MKQKLVIIGWTWDFSSFIAKFLNENFWEFLDIFITWRNKESAIEVSKKIWVWYFENNLDAVKTCDIIVFWVSINKTCEVIQELWPHIKPWSVVLDITSIKKSPSEFLNKYVPKSCLVIPTHPMFWPGLKQVDGQIIVLTPEIEVKNDKRYALLKKELQKLQMKVIESTPEEHDSMMAVVQWLTHYSMFVIWKTIKRYWIDVLKTFDFVSPIYKLMISSVSRYIGQSPELYADIQMNNEEILKIHELFTNASNEFNEVVKNKDREEFVSMVLKTREYFWEKNCSMWQKYTDKIVYFLWKEINKLKENIAKEIILENIYNKNKKSWILHWFDDHNIFLNDEKLDINEWLVL